MPDDNIAIREKKDGEYIVSATSHCVSVSACSHVHERAPIKLIRIDGKAHSSQTVLLQSGLNFIEISTTMSKGIVGIITSYTGNAANRIKVSGRFFALRIK